MKRKPRWHKLEVVLSKPNTRMKSLRAVLEEKELGRWLARHLEAGYAITVTKAADNVVPLKQTA